MLTAKIIGSYFVNSVIPSRKKYVKEDNEYSVKAEEILANLNKLFEEEKKEEVKVEEPKTEEVKEEKKEETKVELVEEKKEELKTEEKEEEVIYLGTSAKEKKVEKKEEVKAEEIKEDKEKKSKRKVKVKTTPRKVFVINDDDKITMQNRKTFPVKVSVVKTKNPIENNVEITKEEEHRLHHFVEHLRSMNINFTAPRRMPTGLYEVDVYQINTGRQVKLSFDINGLLYSDDIKFFIGHMNPGEEYMKPAIMMTNKSIEAVINNRPIPQKYCVSESLFNLNKVLDMQTLKEKDPEKRAKIFELAAKAISDEDIYNGILRAANGEAFRFAFCRYISPEEFSIVSSKRNLSSNLTNDKLRVSKEIWINIKDMTAELITKKA